MEPSGPDFLTRVFGPPLKVLFTPMNELVTAYYLPWATICAMLLYFSVIVWVWTLRREYANVDAPKQGLLYDLRFWTIVCMMPHILVYLYFAKWG